MDHNPILVLRPEVIAGGFSRDNSTVAFYTRVSMLKNSQSVVMDYGAGRGAQIMSARRTGVAGYQSLVAMKGSVAKLVGVDVDPVVMTNDGMDEAVVLEPQKPMPFDDETFDLIYCDWVLEHIENPTDFSREIHRVLKRDGWFCARTPNRWGYIGIGSRLIPDTFHPGILSFLQPGHKSHDKFKKYYRINTLSHVSRFFDPGLFRNGSYYFNSEPNYFGGRALIFKVFDFLQSILPMRMSNLLFVFLQKR